jgi:hypothetical protein
MGVEPAAASPVSSRLSRPASPNAALATVRYRALARLVLVVLAGLVRRLCALQTRIRD